MEKQNNKNKDNLKYAIAYIPLVAFFLFFIEKDMKDEYKKHLKYAMILFGMYMILSMVLKIMWMWYIIPLVFIIYLVISGILAFKAFNGESMDVEILDNIGDTIDEKLNSKK